MLLDRIGDPLHYRLGFQSGQIDVAGVCVGDVGEVAAQRRRVGLDRLRRLPDHVRSRARTGAVGGPAVVRDAEQDNLRAVNVAGRFEIDAAHGTKVLRPSRESPSTTMQGYAYTPLLTTRV